MNNNETFLFVICYSAAIILIYKFIKYKIKTKSMKLIIATCTDITIRTTYHHNIRVYYYKYNYNNIEYTASDKSRLKIPGFNPQINKKFKIFIEPNNPNNCITPLKIFYFQIFLITSIFLLILPFLIT